MRRSIFGGGGHKITTFLSYHLVAEIGLIVKSLDRIFDNFQPPRYLFFGINGKDFMRKRRTIFYDTETTGICPKKNRVIEIAAFDPDNETTFEKLINPGCPIPPSATAIHNITDDMVKEAPSFDQIGPDFAEFCGENAILIAHNNHAFDQRFLEAEYARNDLILPQFDHLDSLLFARRYRPDLPRHGLQALREYYGIPANQAHRALDDVKVLTTIFYHLIDDLDMETVYQLMQQKETIDRMPFGKHQGKRLEEIPKSYIQWLKENGALDKESNKALKEAWEALNML